MAGPEVDWDEDWDGDELVVTRPVLRRRRLGAFLLFSAFVPLTAGVTGHAPFWFSLAVSCCLGGFGGAALEDDLRRHAATVLFCTALTGMLLFVFWQVIPGGQVVPGAVLCVLSGLARPAGVAGPS